MDRSTEDRVGEEDRGKRNSWRTTAPARPDEPDLGLDEAFDAAGETVADDQHDQGMTSLGVRSASDGASDASNGAGAEGSRRETGGIGGETSGRGPLGPTPAATSSSGVDRTCVLCGIDCHDQPRTKDTKGRYFCLACFHRALAAKEAGVPLKLLRCGKASPNSGGSGGAWGAASSQSGLPLDDFVVPEDSPLRSSDASGSLSAEWSAAREALSGSSCSLLCPECRAPMPSEATCCASCGAHTLGGRRWSTRVAKGVVSPVNEASGETDENEALWTTVVGGVSTGLGAVGVLTGIALAATALFAFAGGSPTETLVARATLGPGIALLAGWKLSAGLDCLRGRSVAVDHLRTWATTTLVILVLAAAGWIGWTFWIDSDWSVRLHQVFFALVGAALLSIWPLVIRWWSRHAVLQLL